jgi:hypothetical protein
METLARHSLTDRMLAAAKLEVWAYEEVEADETATSQAAIVVVIVAVARAIGSWEGGLGAIIGGAISAILGWLLWSAITYFIGTRLFHGTATWGELLRTIGFAQAPGVLLILAAIPLVGWLVRFAVFVWILIAGIVAIRQALDFDTGRAVATAVIGWLVMVAVSVVAAIIAGVGSALV